MSRISQYRGPVVREEEIIMAGEELALAPMTFDSRLPRDLSPRPDCPGRLSPIGAAEMSKDVDK